MPIHNQVLTDGYGARYAGQQIQARQSRPQPRHTTSRGLYESKSAKKPLVAKFK